MTIPGPTITATQYERLSLKFDELHKASNDVREDELQRLAAQDANLAALLRRMLELDDDGGSATNLPDPLLDIEQIISSGDKEWSCRVTPAMIGKYRVLSRLGWGSAGDVYLAEQRGPASRLVAIKLLRHYCDPSQSSRYSVEARALSSLSHHGIAQIHEADVSADGHPYLVMEYVDGVPIDRAGDAYTLNLEQRLRLFTSLCHAVHHAHQHGVIHRDLKPSNILVVLRDERPHVKVIDFGIARLIGDRAAFTETLTAAGQLLGTLVYMSPEQLRGETTDTRSDVYALGVILHLLLTDQLPHDLNDVVPADALRIMSSQSPTRAMAADRLLRGDLKTIVNKAMARDRTNRYQSVHALGTDVQRYLSHEPIEARPPSQWYLLRMLIRRHRLLTASVGIFITMLFGAMYLIDDARREAVHARVAAEQQYEEARRMSNYFLRDVVTRLERVPGATSIQRELLDEILRQSRMFLDARPNDEALLDDYARTLMAISGLYARHNPRDEAAAGISEELIRIREHLVTVNPDQPDHWMELALAYVRRGDVARVDGRLEECLANCHHALKIDTWLVEQHPDSRRYRDNLFWDHDRIALALLKQDDPASLPWAQRSLEVANQLQQRHPEHYLTHYAVSQAHLTMARTLAHVRDVEEARPHLTQALDHAVRLNDMYPHSTFFLEQIISVTLFAARFGETDGDDDAALRIWTLMHEAARQLLQAEPDRTRWKIALAQSEQGLRALQAGHERIGQTD